MRVASCLGIPRLPTSCDATCRWTTLHQATGKMERAIRWSPSASSPTSDHRFLLIDVTGRAFKLNRVISFDGITLHHEALSTYSKVPAFRAFDWSPVDESLIAIGQASGDASVLRMAENSQESYSFPIRSPRPCNAVAFSHHGLLAAGVDRTRGDFCLNVWDVNQRLAMGGPKGSVEPVKKLAASEPITSIKFFKDQPDMLVTGVKGQYVRIYDLRGELVSRDFGYGSDLLQRAEGARLSSSQHGACIIWQLTRWMRIISRPAHQRVTLPSVFGIVG